MAVINPYVGGLGDLMTMVEPSIAQALQDIEESNFLPGYRLNGYAALGDAGFTFPSFAGRRGLKSPHVNRASRVVSNPGQTAFSWRSCTQGVKQASSQSMVLEATCTQGPNCLNGYCKPLAVLGTRASLLIAGKKDCGMPGIHLQTLCVCAKSTFALMG